MTQVEKIYAKNIQRFKDNKKKISIIFETEEQRDGQRREKKRTMRI